LVTTAPTNGLLARLEQTLDQKPAEAASRSGFRRDATRCREDGQRTLLSMLDRRTGIATVPLILRVRDINDQELGPLLTSLLSRSKAIKTVMVSLMAYTGTYGS
jgi:hypothetical protein